MKFKSKDPENKGLKEEQPLNILGSLDDVLKVSVPKEKPKDPKKDE